MTTPVPPTTPPTAPADQPGQVVIAPAQNIPAAPSAPQVPAGWADPYAGQVPAAPQFTQPAPARRPSPADMPARRPAPQDDDGDGWDSDPAPRQRARSRGRARDDYDTDGLDGDDGGREPLPRSVQNLVGRLRDENAGHRVRARDASDRYDALVSTMAEALDLDPTDITPDSVTEILGTAADEARQSHLERHAGRAAFRAGADVDGLLDSGKFTAKLDKLDPFSEDFAEKVNDLVADFLDENPRFALSPAGQGQAPAPVPARSSADMPGGAGNPQLITEADLDHMSPEEINTARLNGELDHLL
ncbi:hypothetical protein [Parafrankia sp. EUN1f]|uniref:hypothetical protein n=1 Tax=Parafrankia sp. EUN1f TaxID=102897 RepID=UPI0001C46CDC|nr:hypothetical protein [Parafrankia sp. EUN1f]EFC80239.1 hypothetical protein FrEUN1fDRAFT_6633 [Parafrankia sp. EUN1f]